MTNPQVDHIEIDGKVIEIGFECDDDPTCIPEGVADLEHLLGRMIARYGTCPQ